MFDSKGLEKAFPILLFLFDWTKEKLGETNDNKVMSKRE
jgi:hypothetical protein